MDPYLEASWHDVHQRLCVYACDALQPQVVPALRARIEERLVVEVDSVRERAILPDVTITEQEPWRMTSSGAAVDIAEPLVIREDEPATEGFIHIFEPKNNGRLVTAIEFLSPSNKSPGEGQEEYLKKRREYREAGVSLVEIDLLRRGERILTAHHRIPPSHRTAYQISVRRAYRGQSEVYPVPLRRALPMIRIPLREGDADAHLNVQALIEQAYRNGAYGYLDYSKPPEPPLDAADAAWAAELLRTESPRG